LELFAGLDSPCFSGHKALISPQLTSLNNCVVINSGVLPLKWVEEIDEKVYASSDGMQMMNDTHLQVLNSFVGCCMFFGILKKSTN
jgi:hypothetical protein